MVLSASLGAGHDGAAAELARRLRARGYRVSVADYLACFPLRIGDLMRWVYGVQLRRAPWAYEATFRVWYLGRPLRLALTGVLDVLTRRRLERLLSEPGVCGVVSTYPLQSLVLGRARRRGRLGVPVATFVTDFGVHPLWIHGGVDLTMCVHAAAAEEARRRTPRAVVTTGPLVRAEFRHGVADRAAARRAFGLPAAADLALIVAGSWGVGDVEGTFDRVQATGRWVPVAACGENDALRRRLAARGYGVALGWTDRMHELMSAADVLVQNAGGLSCMEAFALGVPVVTFQALAGHGKANAACMQAAGVASVARRGTELAAVLDRAAGAGRAGLVGAGRALFSEGAGLPRQAALARDEGFPGGAGFSGDAAAAVDRLVRHGGLVAVGSR